MSRRVIQEFMYFVADEVVEYLLTSHKKTISNFYLLDLAWLHLWCQTHEFSERTAEMWGVPKTTMHEVNIF